MILKKYCQRAKTTERRRRENKKTEGGRSRRINKEDDRDQETKKDKDRKTETETERRSIKNMTSTIEMIMTEEKRDDCSKCANRIDNFNKFITYPMNSLYFIFLI